MTKSKIPPELELSPYMAESCDAAHCWKRRCMTVGEHKGSYVQGRGYTSYFAKPRVVCWTRHLHGCPVGCDKPENEDVENMRCCFRPDYRKRGTAPKGWLSCATCGAMAPRVATRDLNALPTLPGVACRHARVQTAWIVDGWWACEKLLKDDPAKPGTVGWSADPCCDGFWDHRPAPFEPPQYTRAEYDAELSARLSKLSQALAPKADGSPCQPDG